MSERQPYSRVYWSVFTDEKFVGIRSDMRHFGSWTLMLLVADMAYPAPAFVPPTVPRKSLSVLAEAGLVDLSNDGMFTVRGLRREREERASAATRQPKRDPVGTQAGPGRVTSQVIAEDEPRQAEADASRAPDAADAYWTLVGTYPAGNTLTWIDQLASEYGTEAVIRAVAKAHGLDRSTQTLLSRTRDLLRSEARALSLKAQAAQREAIAAKRSEPRVAVDPEKVRAELMELMKVAA